MKYNILIVFLLITFSLFGQQTNTKNCKYPFNSSADSLVKFIINDIYRYNNNSHNIEAKFNSIEFKKYFYDSTLPINYDSIFTVCIQYLIAKIGEKLVCQNIDMYINSFNIYNNKQDFWIEFGFTYPILKNERINLKFKYCIDFCGDIAIFFPQNIPDCNNQENCGIKITREKAIELLKNSGIIKEKDNITMEVQGLKWKVTLTEDGWSFRHLSINIQTGEFSNFGGSHRID